MPTGYTSGVADGKITDFKTYALQSARAFGACIMLRDEPLGDDIPEFEPSDHHAKRVAEANKELADFIAFSEDQKLVMYADEMARRVNDANDRIKENDEQRKRYEAMLAQAKAFKAPTPDHQEYAKFLVSQLEESIRFDCGGDYYEQRLNVPTYDEWVEQKLEILIRDIKYHREHNADELKRTASRNKWVADLKNSLK